MRKLAIMTILAGGAAACTADSDRSSVNCGIASLAVPQSVISQFGIPRQTLSRAPVSVPERLTARVAAGPALTAIAGREGTGDSLLVIGIEGSAEGMALGFGVLMTDRQGNTRGVMLFEGLPVEGAPRIGTVSMGSVTAPLIGVEADPASYENPDCPIFPDSTSM